MPKGGLARRAGAIAQFREQAQGTVLLLDSGDSIFAVGKPTATSDPTHGALPVEAMNAMKYDAIALGEREVATSTAVVDARFKEASFPILSANVKPAGVLPNVQPYILRQVGDYTVAVIGVTYIVAAQQPAALGVSLTVESAVEAVQLTVDELKGKADAIVILSNMDQAGNIALAQKVPGIDAIVGVYGGGQVKAQAIPGPAGQVVLHSSGMQGKSLGVLTLQFDAQGQVIGFSGQLVDLTSQFANDPGLLTILQKYGVKP